MTDVGRLGSSDYVMISCSIVVHDDNVDTAKTTINWRKADWNTTRRDMAGVELDNNTAGGGLDRASATTLSEPGVCLRSVVNSEM